MIATAADLPRHLAIVRKLDRHLNDQERERFITWARALLELRETTMPAAQKARRALRMTRTFALAGPVARSLWEQLKDLVWNDRSWAARGAMSGIAVALATAQGKNAGLAAFGTAVAVPLWVVFGAGGSFAGTLIGELETTLRRGAPRRRDTVDADPQPRGPLDGIEETDWELIENAVVQPFTEPEPEPGPETDDREPLWRVFRRAYRTARERHRAAEMSAHEAPARLGVKV